MEESCPIAQNAQTFTKKVILSATRKNKREKKADSDVSQVSISSTEIGYHFLVKAKLTNHRLQKNSCKENCKLRQECSR